MAVRRCNDNTDQGKGETCQLRDRCPGAEQYEITDKDGQRNAGLLDHDIDDAGLGQGRVEQNVEQAEARCAIGEQQRQMRFDDRPVSLQLLP